MLNVYISKNNLWVHTANTKTQSSIPKNAGQNSKCPCNVLIKLAALILIKQ